MLPSYQLAIVFSISSNILCIQVVAAIQDCEEGEQQQ